MPSLHSGAETDRPETTNTTLPLIPKVVWQQPHKTHLNTFHKTTTETHKNTHIPEFKQRKDKEKQIKETSPQVSGSSSAILLGNQSGSTLIQCLNDCKK